MRVLLAVLALLAALVPASFHVAAASRRIQLGADEHVLRRATVIVDHHGDALSWLRQQPSVRSADRGADGRTITIHLRDGLTEAILPHGVVATRLPQIPAVHAQAVARDGGAGALVLAPFASQFGLASMADQVAGELQAAGFRTTELTDGAVTVDVMKTLSSYKAVYITGHAGWLDSDTVVISTGQIAPYANGQYLGTDYLSDIGNGNLILGSVAGDAGVQIYYDITPRFVSSYLGHFMPGSLFVANGCGTMYYSTFANALLADGVSTYLGWSNEVMNIDMEQSGYLLLGDMLGRGMTAGAALQDVLANGKGVSSVNGTPSHLVLAGDASLHLDASVPGPAPPPTATPVPVVPKATLPPAPMIALQVTPATLLVGRTTDLAVRVGASGLASTVVRLVVNGRQAVAGVHHRAAHAGTVVVFRERPRRPGVIVVRLREVGGSAQPVLVRAVLARNWLPNR